MARRPRSAQEQLKADARRRARKAKQEAAHAPPPPPLKDHSRLPKEARSFTEQEVKSGIVVTSWEDQPEPDGEAALPPLLEGDDWSPADDLPDPASNSRDARRVDLRPVEVHWGAGPMPKRA